MYFHNCKIQVPWWHNSYNKHPPALALKQMTVRYRERTEIIKQPLNVKCEDGYKLSKVWFKLLSLLTTATFPTEQHHQSMPTLIIAMYQATLLIPLDSTMLNTPTLTTTVRPVYWTIISFYALTPQKAIQSPPKKDILPLAAQLLNMIISRYTTCLPLQKMRLFST